jgi:signal transduction histidine kinase
MALAVRLSRHALACWLLALWACALPAVAAPPGPAADPTPATRAPTGAALPPELALAGADFLSRDTAQPPASGDPAWQAVRLPHVWNGEQQAARGGWYRLRFDAPPDWFATPKALALYLPQAHVNAEVWLNGTLLGDGGRLDDPMTFHWNHPFLFAMPRAALRPAGNEVWVRLRAVGGFGLLAPLTLGPERVLHKAWESRRFWQAEIHGVLCLVLGTLALASLALWNGRRHDTQYLWLGISCAAWSAFALFLYGQDFWVDPLVMQWLAHAGTNWWVTALVHYVHRQTRGPRVGLERGLVVLTLAFNVATAVLPPLVRVHLFSLIHVLLLVALAYLVVHAWRHGRRTGTRAPRALALLCLAVLLAGLHDVVITMPVQWSSAAFVEELSTYRFYLTPFGAPIASLLLGVHLARRFVVTLREVESLNGDLARRIEAARADLAQHYEGRSRLEQAQAASRERERIVREMHDGIGGQLMTVLRGVERGAFSQERVAEVLQDSLDDLRLLIDASAASSRLLPALAAWRHRWDPRLEALGLELRWSVDESLGELELPPNAVLQIMRLLQEAVINALKHAGAQTVAVEARHHGGRLVLTVRDDGQGLDAARLEAARADGTGHHGLRSMQARATAIGADLHLGNDPGGGAVVRLSMPLPLPLSPGPDAAAQPAA